MFMKVGKFLVIVFLILALLAVIKAFSMPKSKNAVAVKEHYKIINTWKMPAALKEISGIAWLSNDEIACVQDEDGIIFIYNLRSEKVVQEIRFGNAGDYEGIAVHGKNAYVLRSDGVIYEITRFRESDAKTTYFKSVFGAKNNMESITLDAANNRLITITKDRDPYSEDYKGLYQIPLSSKQTDINPILKINMADKALKDYKKKKSYKNFCPSDVAIHPKSGNYYITEGSNPKMIIMDKTGTIIHLIALNSNDFPQPEGITFAPNGTMYIATEGTKKAGAILEVVLE